MYEQCPKCGHPTASADGRPLDHCTRCGLIYAKYLKTRFRVDSPEPPPESGRASLLPNLATLVGWVSWDDRPVDPLRFWGQVVIWVGFLIWGLRLVWMDLETNAIGFSFMHNVNLMFHEAGHALFRPFGEFMTILGGSLMQVLMPAIVTVAFLWKNRDPFGASIGLWWTGQSLMDVAVYINDARAMVLPLLGGGTGQDRPGFHDWNNILGMLGWLKADHTLAWMTDVTGEMMMLAAMAWGGWTLRAQYRNLAP